MPNAEVQRNLMDSATAFSTIVWPRLCYRLGCKSDLVPVETGSDTTLRVLDADAGIDYVAHTTTDATKTIASRVQFGPNPYRSFTIRSARQNGQRTELDKLLEAYHTRANLTNLTVQAYVSERGSGGRLLAAHAIETPKLVEFVDYCVNGDGPRLEEKTNPTDGTRFKVVRVYLLDRHGYEVVSITGKESDGYQAKLFGPYG